MQTEQINFCRGCGSRDNFKHLNKFETYPLFDDIVNASKSGSEYLDNLSIIMCNHCNLLQNPKNIDFENYYDDYIYSVGTSKHAIKYMETLVTSTLNLIKAKHSLPQVIDIGSSDGQFLQLFQAKGCNVLGFEGSSILAEISNKKNIKTINKLFSLDSVTALKTNNFDDPDLICLLHTFDHLPYPSEFLSDIKSILRPQSYLLLEVHSLDKMINQNEGAIFAHEHTCYYSEVTLKNLLLHHHFKIIAYNFIDEQLMRGASQVILCQYDPNLVTNYIPTDNISKDTIQFANNLKNANLALKDYVIEKNSAGITIAGFGGWGRGIGSIAQSCLTENDLTCVFDNNKFLHNCFIPGTKIPIYNPSKEKLKIIDEIIIFNYGYFDEIKAQIRDINAKIKITNVNEIRSNSKSIEDSHP